MSEERGDAAAVAQVDDLVRTYADRVTDAAGSEPVGVYLVGSYALGDVRHDSDVDFITVVAQTPDAGAASRIARLHAEIAERWPARSLEGCYLERSAPNAHPSSVLALHVNSRADMDRGNLGLVEWETLRRHGYVARGAPVTSLGLADLSAELPAFSRANLAEYWSTWTSRFRRIPEGITDRQLAYELATGVLGAPRLIVAMADGAIVSKTAAGHAAKRRFGARWHPQIDAALAYRATGSDQAISALLALQERALAFIEHVIAEGLALAPRP